MPRISVSLAFLLLLTPGLLSSGIGGEPTPPVASLLGRVLDRVNCVRDATQSYALYVPSSYTPEKKWPVIFCFDAGARGVIPVERLKVAADRYGYLVAGSLTSRNGPWAQNATAADAMFRDVTGHFSIDPQRIYTAGMSGGARVATSIALAGVAKGVIACGAGFPVPDQIPREIHFGFFGVAGGEDFNYAELQRLDADLAERQAPHRIVSFEGGHSWAPATVLTEGVEWLEVQALRAGTRAKDSALIDALLQTRLAAVPAAPPVERWKALHALADDFAGLADVTTPANEAAALATTRQVKDALRAERALLARESQLLRQLGDAGTVESGNQRHFAEDLRRKADAPLDSPERRMIRRAIAGYASMARETVRGLFEKADYDNAEAFLDFGVVLQPDHKSMWFDLARARAFNGSRQRALEALEQSVAAGYSDASHAEAEPAFAKVRRDARFQAALEKMRAEAAHPSLRLPVLRVSTALTGAELRLVYLPPNGPGSPPLSLLKVESVRIDSAAARGGLQEGMEITSIQGLAIRGLTEREFNDAMGRRVKKEIVLKACEPNREEREIRIALRAAVPVDGAPVIPAAADLAPP